MPIFVLLTKTVFQYILKYILTYTKGEGALMLSYQFPAVRGYQAKKEYYICMIPLGLMSRIFITDYSDVAAEHRAQRRLNEARIPAICD